MGTPGTHIDYVWGTSKDKVVKLNRELYSFIPLIQREKPFTAHKFKVDTQYGIGV
jgi:hypothetical protein